MKSESTWALSSLKKYKQAYPAPAGDFRLPGVAKGNERSLASAYVANMREGIMAFEQGQIANIIRHAEKYHVRPRKALEAIVRRVLQLGENADEYQKKTAARATEALRYLR